MSMLKLTFRPGVNRDVPNYAGEGGWFECDKVRFRLGLPQKIGGWQKVTPAPFFGVCRQMWDWVTTFGDNPLALGTNNKLYLTIGGLFFDITPLRQNTPTLTTPDTDDSINVTSGSTTVLVSLAVPHGATTGSFVTLSGIVGPIGGIPADELNVNTSITAVSANDFSFEVPTPASSTVSNAGGTAIDIDFEIAPGNPIAVNGTGWGTGTWGRGSWGLGPPDGLGVFVPQRDWWFANFDNDLVGNIRNGPGYWWVRGPNVSPAVALDTRAISLSDFAASEGFDPNAVPSQIMQLLVSQQDRHLIAFGAVPFGSTNPSDFDPMLIRWASQDQPGQWTPLITNSAGDLRVSRGSRIIRALPTRQEILVWTDTTLYTFQFLGTTDVFSLQEYADNVSLIGPRAAATASDVVYWMGRDKFYYYDGRTQTLPCTLLDQVFRNISLDQADQIVAGVNEEWNEVWWFYPTQNSNFNDAYVVYNYIEQLWYYGTISRSAWLSNPIGGRPLAATTLPVGDEFFQGYLFVHEVGNDDDGAPMHSFIRSNDVDLADGDQFVLTRRILPDIDFVGSTSPDPEVDFQVLPRNFPGSSFRIDPADTQRVISTTVGQYTDQVFIRARARQMALKIESNQLGVQWKLGAPRVDLRPDGRR